MTGATDKIDAFIGLMRALGLVEVSRTGVVAISRGPRSWSIRARCVRASLSAEKPRKQEKRQGREACAFITTAMRTSI